MSTISTTHHKVTAFTKDTKAFTDNVLLRIIDKTRKGEKSELGGSKAVSVPIISQAEIAERISEFMPVLENTVHDARQQIARGLILEGLTEIPTDSIDLGAVLSFLNAQSARATTESMQAWFVENYGDAALEFVCKQIKFDPESLSEEQTKVVLQKSNVLRDVFASFASGKYSPPLPVCKMVLGFISFCGEGIDTRMSMIQERTEKLKAQQLALLDADFSTLLESMPTPKAVKTAASQNTEGEAAPL